MGGIIEEIGTAGGCAPFQNPHNAGLVKCSQSAANTGDISCLVDRGPVHGELFTLSGTHAWFQYEFVEVRVHQITGYRLQHGCKDNRHAIRNWEAQVSED